MNPFNNTMFKSGCIAVMLFSAQTLAGNYQLFLVRHAEKAVSTSTDPELSECGKLQANALAILLKEVSLPKLFHTPFRRTTMTATALLQQGRDMQSYDPAKLAEFSKQLQQQQQSAVVVGHSNTTPQLTALLSGKNIEPMTEQQYGVIYQLTFINNEFQSLNQLQLPQPTACIKN